MGYSRLRIEPADRRAVQDGAIVQQHQLGTLQ